MRLVIILATDLYAALQRTTMGARAAGFGKPLHIRVLDSGFQRKPGGLQTEAELSD